MLTSTRRRAARRTVLALSLGALTVGLAAPVADAASPKTKRVSVTSSGAEVDQGSFLPVITPDGRFIAFESSSDDLVGIDSNEEIDVYVRNMRKKKTRLVSVHSNGTPGDGESAGVDISASGRFVVFETAAETLFHGDLNGRTDIVIRDRKKGKTKLISKSSSGAQGTEASLSPDITPDGRFVVFQSASQSFVSGDTMGISHIYIHDRHKKRTKLVSKRSNGKRGDANSSTPSVSANGRFIAFASHAENLVKNDTNGVQDIFVHDRKKRKTTRVSVKSNRMQADASSGTPRISNDGRIVAFGSDAKLAGSDKNGAADIYVHNRGKKKTKQASVSSKGAGGADESRNPSISPDGRFVAFRSQAGNLVKGGDGAGWDVYVRDRKLGKTKLISVGVGGAVPDGSSFHPSISAGGRFVAFYSGAGNLVGSDSNNAQDVFRRGPLR